MERSKQLKMCALMEQLGGFGLFQKLTFLMGCCAAAMSGMAAVTVIFVGKVLPHRCLVPECENASDASYMAEFLNFTAPFSGTGNVDSCQTFQRKFSFNYQNESGKCEEDYFSNSTTVKCSQWVYDTSIFQSTSVSEFDVVCDSAKWEPLAGSLFMTGMFVGAAFVGDLSDRIGRKNGVVMALIIYSFGGLLGAVSMNYSMFLATRFILGVGGVALFQIPFVLTIEYVPSQWRNFCGIMIEIPFAVGEALYGFYAYFIRSWRLLQVACTLTALLLLPYWWILPESVRWLFSQGKKKEATRTIARIAKCNKITVSNEIYDATKYEETGSASDGADQATEEKMRKKRTMLDLIRYPNLRKRTAVLLCCWFAVTLNFYGLNSLSVNLAGDIFVNFLATVLIEIPANLFAYLILDRIGRKCSLMVTLLIGGFSCIISGAIPESLGWLIVTMNTIGKFGTTAAFAVVYIYTAEIYPTPLRSLGVGVCSMTARVGGILAPYIAYMAFFYSALPVFIFGSVAVLSGLLVVFLPETLNTELPQTVEESENLGANDSWRYFVICGNRRQAKVFPQ